MNDTAKTAREVADKICSKCVRSTAKEVWVDRAKLNAIIEQALVAARREAYGTCPCGEPGCNETPVGEPVPPQRKGTRDVVSVHHADSAETDVPGNGRSDSAGQSESGLELNPGVPPQPSAPSPAPDATRLRGLLAIEQTYVIQLKHELRSQEEELVRQENDRLEAENVRLRAALEEIKEGYDECGCDHSDENCCNLVGEFCPHCIAEAALAEGQK